MPPLLAVGLVTAIGELPVLSMSVCWHAGHQTAQEALLVGAGQTTATPTCCPWWGHMVQEPAAHWTKPCSALGIAVGAKGLPSAFRSELKTYPRPFGRGWRPAHGIAVGADSRLSSFAGGAVRLLVRWPLRGLGMIAWQSLQATQTDIDCQAMQVLVMAVPACKLCLIDMAGENGPRDLNSRFKFSLQHCGAGWVLKACRWQNICKSNSSMACR